MGINVTTVGDVSYRGTGKIIKKLLMTGNYQLVSGKFGQPYTIDQNQNVTAKWRRYDDFPQAIAPLSEGVTPAGRKPSSTDITATMQQFGDWVEMSDVLWYTHEDSIPDELVDKCGKQMGETIEVLTISALKSDTTVYYANHAANRAALSSPPLPGDFQRMERFLSNHKATYLTKMIKASPQISTEPIPPGYVVMGHTDLKADLSNMEGWIPVQNYADSASRIHQSEAGSVGVFRFLLTPLFTPWMAAGAASNQYLSNGNAVDIAANADVYPVIIVSEDAYGVVRLQGFDAVKPSVLKPKPSASDPLGQRGSVGWLTWFAAVVLNSNWVIRYECNATANP